MLDRWCEREHRDPAAIARTVNVGFYLGADSAGASRARARFTQEWGASETRTGFLRGEARHAGETIAAYRDLGVEQINIALRSGPYDWDALAAFSQDVMPAFR